MTAMKLYTTIQICVGALNSLAVKIRKEEIATKVAVDKAEEYAQALLDEIR